MILKFNKPKKQFLKENSKSIISDSGGSLYEEEKTEIPAGNIKLYITKSVDNIDEKKAQLTAEFIKFCCKQLAITQPCKIYFTGSRGGPIITTASYNPNNHDIWIYVKNRNMIADPFRSLAHELRHFKQNLDGVLTDRSGEDGSVHEGEAHCFSGLMIRLFGKLHPEIFN